MCVKSASHPALYLLIAADRVVFSYSIWEEMGVLRLPITGRCELRHRVGRFDLLKFSRPPNVSPESA